MSAGIVTHGNGQANGATAYPTTSAHRADGGRVLVAVAAIATVQPEHGVIAGEPDGAGTTADTGDAPAPPVSFAAVAIDHDDDLPAVFGKIDSAGSPRVALIAPRGSRELSRQLGMRRLQRHLDLTGKDLILVTRSRALRIRGREEGVPAVTSLRRVNFDRPNGFGLQLGWMTLRLPTLGALLAVALFVATVVAGAVVLFWYVPTATVTVFVPAETMVDTIDIVADSKAAEASIEKGIVPARRREIQVQRTLPGPATGISSVPVEHAAIGLTFANRTNRPVIVPKGTIVRAADGTVFTVGSDVTLAARIGASGEAIALAQRPGTAGNVPPRTATLVDAPLSDQVSVTNPAAGEKGTDIQQQVVSDNDVEFLKRLAKDYLADAGKKEMLRLYADSETVYGDSARVELGECTPVPAVGQAARYTEITCTAKVSMLNAPDADLGQIWIDRFRAKLPANRMLLDDSCKATLDHAGALDQTFDRLPATMRVTCQAAPIVDRQELRRELTGKSRAGVERAVRDHVETSASPAVELASWAPWLPRGAQRITLHIKPAP